MPTPDDIIVEIKDALSDLSTAMSKASDVEDILTSIKDDIENEGVEVEQEEPESELDHLDTSNEERLLYVYDGTDELFIASYKDHLKFYVLDGANEHYHNVIVSPNQVTDMINALTSWKMKHA